MIGSLLFLKVAFLDWTPAREFERALSPEVSAQLKGGVVVQASRTSFNSPDLNTLLVKSYPPEDLMFLRGKARFWVACDGGWVCMTPTWLGINEMPGTLSPVVQQPTNKVVELLNSEDTVCAARWKGEVQQWDQYEAVCLNFDAGMLLYKHESI